MSLLEQYSHTCVIQAKARVPDGEGGCITTWTDGAEFAGRIGYSSTSEARRAEQQGMERVFGVLADQDADIHYGDYFKDAETGETYRVTSEPGDNHSPASASMQLKHFTCERRELPS